MGRTSPPRHISVTGPLLRPLARSLHQEPWREKTTKTGCCRSYFKQALNEPHKHGSFISRPTCLRSPSISQGCFSSFPSPQMKRVSFRAPLSHWGCPTPPNNSPTSSQPLLLLLLATYLSFLFWPFCFPAKLLNSSSVGCWYHRRLGTKERRRWGCRHDEADVLLMQARKEKVGLKF